MESLDVDMNISEISVPITPVEPWKASLYDHFGIQYSEYILFTLHSYTQQ